MYADNTIYTRIKNGIVVVSSSGPAILIHGNRHVIRDGPHETPPLCLTRAGRRLWRIIVCGDAGTGIAFSQLDWNGTVIATTSSVPNVPALTRAQVLAKWSFAMGARPADRTCGALLRAGPSRHWRQFCRLWVLRHGSGTNRFRTHAESAAARRWEHTAHFAAVNVLCTTIERETALMTIDPTGELRAP